MPLQLKYSLVEADVKSAQTYYPFGMMEVGRLCSPELYRYGYNGQEADNEIKGDGNSLEYKYRVHDPRLGRFFSIDPLAAKYPYYTPYVFSGNRVIDGIELEGLEWVEFEGQYLVNFSKITEKEVRERLEMYEYIHHGQIIVKEILEKDNDNEFWIVRDKKDIYCNSKGTRVKKYLSSKSYKNGEGVPYNNEIRRNFKQWGHAKDESLEGSEGLSEGLTILGSVAATIDDLSAIGDENTLLEALSKEYGGEDLVRSLKITKIVIGVVSTTKGSVDITIDLRDGKKIQACFDAYNKLFTTTQIISSGAEINKENKKDEQDKTK